MKGKIKTFNLDICLEGKLSGKKLIEQSFFVQQIAHPIVKTIKKLFNRNLRVIIFTKNG